MQFTFTEANLLPDNHPENVLYHSFTKTFGEEGNIIVMAFKIAPSLKRQTKSLEEFE